MKVLNAGMMMCDVPLCPIPRNLFDLDLYKIKPVQVTTGGDALNVATTLTKLNIPSSIVGRIGNDLNGNFVLDLAVKNGIDISNVTRDPVNATPTSYHIIEENGDHHTITYSQIFDELDSTDIPEKAFSDVNLVYFGSALTFRKMDNGGTLDLFKRAHSHGLTTAMDASVEFLGNSGPEEFENLKPTLHQTDIFIPSIAEAKYLTNLEDPHEISEKMKPFGMEIFGIKLGSKGCYLTDFIDEYYISLSEVLKPVDTTGAGDSFMGGFLCAYLHGWDTLKCGKFACVVAGHNVMALGATGGVPSFEQAIEYLESHDMNVEILK